MAHAVDERTTRNGQRRLLVQKIDGRRRRDDILPLVIARKVDFQLEYLPVAHAAQPEMLPPVRRIAGLSLALHLPLRVDHFRFVRGG